MIEKSTRHNEIIGKYGEYFVCNWLSRSSFEVVIVDHTGIDIIASNPKTNKRLGITVKSRTREIGKETKHVNILEGKDDRKKLLDACKAFGCKPWIAIYAEESDNANLFLTSLANYDKKYRGKGNLTETWRMTDKMLTSYESDKDVKHIRIKFDQNRWAW